MDDSFSVPSPSLLFAAERFNMLTMGVMSNGRMIEEMMEEM
jgi:hypothetical protein